MRNEIVNCENSIKKTKLCIVSMHTFIKIIINKVDKVMKNIDLLIIWQK